MPRRLRYSLPVHGLLVAAALCAPSCDDPPPAEEPPPCRTSVVRWHVATSWVEEVDVLLVVDDSASMRGEQEEVGAEVARVLRSLSWLAQPDTSLHVAVVSSDLGAGGAGSLSEGCTYPLGRDGRMLRAPIGGDPACEGAPGSLPYVTAEGGDDSDILAERVGCLVRTGTAGCGFEQPLEAALKALTPAASELRFQQERGGVIESDTAGHGDGANAGFLRDQSQLVIVVITDEDDCSTADMDLFSPSGSNPQYPSSVLGPLADPALQCASHPAALHPVERYIDGFRALRPGMEDFMSLVVVGGVSTELLEAHSETTSIDGAEYVHTDYTALLAEPSVQAVVDESGTSLIPGCTRPAPEDPDNVASRLEAAPPRRLIAVAQGLRELGTDSEVISLCSAVDSSGGDHRLDLGRLDLWWDLRRPTSDPYTGFGLPRPMERDANERVTCRMTETLREGLRCGDHPGRTFLALEGRQEVCLVEQLSIPLEERVPGATIAGAGWYYDDFTPFWNFEASIQTTRQAAPRSGSRTYLECIEQACGTP